MPTRVSACCCARALTLPSLLRRAQCAFDALPDEVLERVLAALPTVHRLRACLLDRRFMRLGFTPALRSALSARHTLLAGDSLYAGASLSSPDGRFNLNYNFDGSLVLYNAATYSYGLPVWTLQPEGSQYESCTRRVELTIDGDVYKRTFTSNWGKQ